MFANFETPFWRPDWSIEHSAQPVSRRPPCLKPNWISRQAPWKTLLDSSRLYSPAIERFTLLMMFEVGEPSFSNCSAQ